MRRGGGEGRGTLYKELYAHALPERGDFFRLEIYKRVGIFTYIIVYKRVGKTAILVNVAQMLAKNTSFVFQYVIKTCIRDVSQGCRSARHGSHN